MSGKGRVKHDSLIDYFIDVGLSLNFGCQLFRTECSYPIYSYPLSNQESDVHSSTEEEECCDGSAYSALTNFHRYFQIVDKRLIFG